MPTASRRDLFKLMGAGAALGTLGIRARSALAASWSDAEQAAARAKLLAYFAHVAPQLLRPAEGALLYPSIAPTLPGKAYATELWDWDTYWTARGLFDVARATRDESFQKRICEHAQGSVLNFLHYQSADGRLPIQVNIHNSDVFSSVSAKMGAANQAKPVFGQLSLLIADECGGVEWLREHFDRLLKFYASWRRTNGTPSGLMVWSNDVAIGNDNDPTTFGRPAFSSANLLLNCLFYRDLEASAEVARRLGRAEDGKRLAAEAKALGESIQGQCWDPRDRFYYTADVQCVDRRAELIPHIERGMAMSWRVLPLRVQTFTGFLPMWCGIASKEQADDLVRLHYANAESFHGTYGVRTLSRQERMYSLERSSNPSNWLGPVWLISNYLVWKGLEDYGYVQEARELVRATVIMLAADLDAHGSLNEYYDPDSGRSLSHEGFLDWNLLAVEMMEKR